MFFVFPPGMGVLPGRVDQESGHDTSMVTTHVDQSCRWPQRPSHFSSIFSWLECNQFVFLFGETKDVCFCGVVFEHRVERGVII